MQTFSRTGNTNPKEMKITLIRWPQVRSKMKTNPNQTAGTSSQNSRTRARNHKWVSCRFRGRDFQVSMVEVTRALWRQPQSKPCRKIDKTQYFRRKSFSLLTVLDSQKLDRWCQTSAPPKRPGIGSNKMGMFILRLQHRWKVNLIMT